MTFSNMTPREHFRLTGTVPGDILELLIEKSERLAEVQNIDGLLEDARAQFPDEDFLQEVIDRVNALAKNLRGANREAAARIAQSLDSISMTTMRSSEYGREQINLALKDLEGVMKALPNIEKSAFYEGRYVGYGRNRVWSIARQGKGWRATTQGLPRQTFEARTLKGISELLDVKVS